MRLQVFLSHSGVCSRRKALEWVKDGKVQVDGVCIKEPSYEIDPRRNCVQVQGKNITLREKAYILLNKPRGVTTTKEDQFAKKTVMDLFPLSSQHLYPVGRLDKDTTGLLLLTNDGDLSYKLMHPKFEIERVYITRLNKDLEERHKIMLEKGINLEGKAASFKVKLLSDKKVKVFICEGRKRQIRKMFALLGYQVMDLERVSWASLELGALASGEWRPLSIQEVASLKKDIGLV